MKILMLTSSKDSTDGWGRYANGFIEQAKNHGHDVVAPDPSELPSLCLGWKQPVYVVQDALRLLKMAKECDVIHSLTEPCAPLAALLSRVSEVPYLLSVIGTYSVLETFPRRVRWMYYFAFRNADATAFLSTYTECVAGKNYPTKNRVIVPGGFDGEADHEPRTGRYGSWHILSVGALKPRKGFHTLISALGKLKENGYDFSCDIIGSLGNVSYVEIIRAMIRKHGLEDCVHLRGKVSEIELLKSYNHANLFVLASEHIGNDFEGLGLVYLEAMARGLPVIGCEKSGAIDMINDNNGRLVPQGSPEALGSAISDILKDTERYPDMSRSALETVKKFRWDVVGERMNDLHRTCVTLSDATKKNI